MPELTMEFAESLGFGLFCNCREAGGMCLAVFDRDKEVWFADEEETTVAQFEGTIDCPECSYTHPVPSLGATITEHDRQLREHFPNEAR